MVELSCTAFGLTCLLLTLYLRDLLKNPPPAIMTDGENKQAHDEYVEWLGSTGSSDNQESFTTYQKAVRRGHKIGVGLGMMFAIVLLPFFAVAIWTIAGWLVETIGGC